MTRNVTFALEPQAFRIRDNAGRRWHDVRATFAAAVGISSRDISASEPRGLR